MNSNDPSAVPSFENEPTSEPVTPPPFLPKLPPRANNAGGPVDPYEWVKWFFAQNPFYIASAILLLYAMFRLSTDAKLFAEEVSQLFFNFGSFQFYELLLAVTAIVLVRRKILYDFSLLVCIESLFVYVPFILITQALLIESSMAMKFSFAGCLLVVLRFGQLRKHFSGMNFRPRLLLLGGVLLLVNVMLPLVVRYIHMESTALNRETRMNPLLEVLWMICAPMFAALAYCLPAPKNMGSHLVQRRTFPLTAFSLWVFVTCAHLYCIGYIHEVPFKTWYLFPLLWTACWMFYVRRADVFEHPTKTLNEALLVPAAVAMVLAGLANQWTLFFGLSATNALIYGIHFAKNRSRFVFQLLSLSVAAMVAGAPAIFMLKSGLKPERTTLIGIGVVGHILLQTILSRNPKAGLFGALAAAAAGAVMFQHNDSAMSIAAQLGICFLLLHSLRWDAQIVGVTAVRRVCAAVWIIHSLAWVASAEPASLPTTVCFAVVVLTVCIAVRMLFGFWGSRTVVVSAGAVLVCAPGEKVILLIKSAPIGLVVLLASFVLFALGTALALTRTRWMKTEAVHNVANSTH